MPLNLSGRMLDQARADAVAADPVTAGLARALLEAAGGDAGARFTLRRAMAQAEAPPRPGAELTHRVTVCVACGEWATASAQLEAAFDGLALRLCLGDAASEAAPADVLPFVVEPRGRASFTWPRSGLFSPHLPYLVGRWQAAMPVFAAVATLGCSGSGAFTVGARQKRPGLSYCGNRPGVWLIPDPDFLASQGYARARQAIRVPQWRDRRAATFWRGHARDHALLAAALAGTDPQALDLAVGGPVSRSASCRFALDMASAPSSAGLFHHLLGGAAVLRVAAADAVRLWFETRLTAWEHYVPVAADLSDLPVRLEWLRSHAADAQEIGSKGRQAALAMGYEAELGLAAKAVAASLRPA